MLNGIKRWLTDSQPEIPVRPPTSASQAFKDEDPAPSQPAPLPDYDDGFDGLRQVWIYLPAGSLEVRWVQGLEAAEGHSLNPLQKALLHDAICQEVHSLVRPQEYWKGSSHSALRKLPQMLGALPQDEPPMLVASRLADNGAACGVWLHLQITQEDKAAMGEGSALFGR